MTQSEQAGSAGSAIRAMREAIGLSIRELAREAGVNFAYLSRVEAGNRNPSDAWVSKVTDAFARLFGRRAA